MKISLNWINDYVDLAGVDYVDLIKKFGLRTAEVEGVEEKGKEISGVIVARILEVNAHPKSDHLHKLKVDTGKEVLDIVCGAPNVRPNMKVALATIGGSVPGMKIEKAVIAGEESYGMCCSKEELGFSEGDEGIWEVDENLPLGTDIKRAYELEDTVFEVDNKSLTNRPDLWCHYGIAREIATILDRPLKPIVTENLQYYTQNGQVDVEVYSENCYRYSAIKVGNVSKKRSTIGMEIRLFYCGMRAINLLADITNYVMLDVGQPMHAFDGDVVKSIQVKDVRTPIEFTTLDNEVRMLPQDSVVICSNNTPVAVAGVMGGLDSEITDNTKNLLLESACFDPTSVRKTAQKLGMRTEASARYEKSLDPELTTLAIARFVHILRDIDPQITILSGLTDVYNKHYPERHISTTMDFINNYVGIKFKPEEVGKILTNLGFKVDFNAGMLSIKVPSFRATKDVTIPVDIVEEVARMYGYDNIPQRPVEASIEPVIQSSEHLMEYDVKYLLAEKYALNEVNSYVWKDDDFNKQYNVETESFIKVMNAQGGEQLSVRSEMMPTLLKLVSENKKYDKELGIFEIGRVCTGLDDNNLCVEEKHLGIALYSTEKSDKDLYFELKDIITDLVETKLYNKLCFEVSKSSSKLVHPKNNAKIVIDGVEVGYMAVVHPKISQKMGKNASISILEIDFSKFAGLKKDKEKVSEITKYQTNSLDLNFVVDDKVLYQEIVDKLSSYKTELDYTINLVDIYKDENLLPNKKSMTFNFQISSKTHTLSGEELDTFQKDMIELAENNGFMLRQ
ncbi:MAG: phenylalanine--tRNA ligase subunit beta [Clostridiales bacterium]|nr:phenylalanine--tRNA ligase subunit beta [Candidatus Apopatousia equi]